MVPRTHIGRFLFRKRVPIWVFWHDLDPDDDLTGEDGDKESALDWTGTAYNIVWTSKNQIDDTDQSDIQFRFKANDGSDDSDNYGTSVSFSVDNLDPTLSSIAWSDVDDSTAISATDTFTFTFSEAMDISTIDNNAGGAADVDTVLAPSSGNYGASGAAGISWTNNTTLVVTLGAGATVASGATVNPTAAVTDAFGNTDNTTSPPSIIDNVGPRLDSVDWNDVDGSGAINVNDTLLLTFSENMNTSTVTSVNVDSVLPITGTGTTYGTTVNWGTQSALTITLGGSVNIVSGDTINPAASVTDAAGNGDSTSSPPAITDDSPPALNSITWTDVDGDKALSEDDTFTFVFSEAMDTSTVDNNGGATDVDTVLAPSAGNYGASGAKSISWTNSTTLVVTLGASLTIARGATINPTAAVTDAAGNGDNTTSNGGSGPSFVDPFGIVFDSVSNNPIQGAVVTIFTSAGVQCTPGSEIVITDANPQTTGSDGAYSFNTLNGDYYITVSATGYTYPSTKSSFPAGRTTPAGSKGETFTIAGVIIEMDQPMDGGSGLLSITKDANKKEVSVGDIVTYTVTIQNSQSIDITSTYLEDKIPAGFKYIEGKATLDGVAIADPTGNRPLTFDTGTISANTTKTLKYQLVVGSGVSFGSYENTAFAKYSDGTAISSTASETVKVIPDPLFDLGTVIGKVFNDKNENGIQDKGEEPIPNAQIVTEDGTAITTDKDGKYHIPGVIPGRHALRLDESTLPEGSYLTTPKVVIEDVREALTSKVNFGVSSGFRPQAAGHTLKSEFPISITKEHGLPKPRLNVALDKNTLLIRPVGGLVESATFRMFTNYSLFIEKWQLDIRDKESGRLFKRFEGKRETLNQPIIWNGADEKGNFLRSEKSYVYALTVWDKNGKSDKTDDKEFYVRKVEEEELRKKEKLEEDVFGKSKSAENELENFWRAQSKVNNLKQQGIMLTGEIVQVISQKSQVTSIRVIKGGKLEGEIPVMEEQSAAKELFERPQFEPESGDEIEPIEIIVPNGEYDIEVTSHKSEVTSGQPVYPVRNENETSSEISNGVYSKHITVGENYCFFIAMADGELGYNMTSGSTEPIDGNDKFKKGFWVDGKLAYYLKAKIKGKYLITSSLDTQREQKELFKYIDPDKYYPVYGDNSQISYDAANTQGILYALIEWDRSQVMYGNYTVAFTDTDLARFTRTLYGGKAQLISVSDTKFGQPDTKIIGYIAKAKQKAAHNEFIGTGGSLYYLKHKYVVEGSDKVRIEVRDKITGLVLVSLEEKEGSDYQIDYDNGRIIFWKPVSQIIQSDTIIQTHLLDGNQLYVVADYEYYTKDKYDEWSKGGRVSQQLGDYLRIGGTYVEDDTQAKKNYKLYGVDSTLQITEGIKFDAEYAESRSEEGSNFISTDGGLSFSELPTDESAEGKAYGLKGTARLLDNLNLSGYYQKIEKGFSTPFSIANQGTEKIGGALGWEIFPDTRLSARHDIQTLLDDGSLQARAQVGAKKTETTSLQLQSRLTEKLQATVEYRRQDVTGKKEEYESETNEDTDIIAGKLAYKLTDKTTVSVAHQESLSGENNRQTTVAAETRLNEYIALRASESVGAKGDATTVGATANVTDRFEFFGDYSLGRESEKGRTSTSSVGAKAKIDDKSSLYNTYSVTDAEKGEKNETLAFGAKKEIKDGYEVTMGREFSKAGEKIAQANTYGVAKEIAGRRVEGTFKEGASFEADGSKYLSNIFGLSGDINDKLASLFNFERGTVQNLDGSQTKRLAASGGLSYVDKDKLKVSSKLEFRHDDSSAASQDSWQVLSYNALEAKVNRDLTVFAKANVSYTENSDSDSTLGQFKELVFGSAYRPVYCDRLNLIGKYTFLEDDSPASQSDYKDIDHIKAHVFGLEAVYDLTDKWQFVEKGALRFNEEKVSGFGFTKSQTWLLAQRVNYNFTKDWQVAGEYRFLNVVQAEDLKQGALLEVSRKIGENMRIAVGYNFTDFSDDLTDLGYTVHGPYVKMTVTLFDRSPAEIARAKKKEEEKNIKKWAWELVHSELARPDSETMKELNNYYYRASGAKAEGRLEEAKEYYSKIADRANAIYAQAESYIRSRVEWEKKLKKYYELAGIYYKEKRFGEAKELLITLEKELKEGGPKWEQGLRESGL